MPPNNHKKFPCEHRERLYAYISQTIEALVEAQERELTDMLPSYLAGVSTHHTGATELISAARAWKQARSASLCGTFGSSKARP